jgi:hypothetical protein
MMLASIKVGDYVDVRAVAVAIDGGLTVRIAGPHSINQLDIAPHLVRHVEPRSAEAIAADAIIKSYPAPSRAVVKA